MNIDIHTLAIFLSLTNVLQVIALFVQYQLDTTRSGLGWWVLGSAAVALGFAFNYLRDVPVLGSIAVIANNIIFVLGMMFFYIGVLRFFDQIEQRRELIAFCAVFILSIIYFTYLNDDLAIRRVMISFAIATMSFFIARVLIIHKPPSVTASSHFLAAVFLAYGIFFTFRMLETLIGVPVGGAFTPTLTQTATYLVTLMASTLWTFGFILLINERINGEYCDAKENSELIFNTSPDAVLITRLTDGYFVKLNEGFTEMTGFVRAEVIGKSILEVNIWKNPADRQKLIAILNKNGYCESLEAVLQRKDGSQFMGVVTAKIFVLQGIPHIISVTRDITERKQSEAEKEKLDAKLRTLSVAIEQSPVTTVITDLEGKIVFVNPKFTESTGYTSEEAIGNNPRILKTENTPLTEYKVLWETILSGQSWHGVFQNRKKSGELYWESAVISPVKDEEGNITNFLAVKEDITERRRLEEKLREQATTDELTGVANRRHMLELANAELKRAVRLKHPLAIALLDIDLFKNINDTCGHAAGDRALIAFTKICQKNIREIDIFARFGGDEFALLLPETSPKQAFAVIERIRMSIMEQPIEIEGNQISITISSGIANLSEEHQETFDILLIKADKALYRAKEAGRNKVLGYAEL